MRQSEGFTSGGGAPFRNENASKSQATLPFASLMVGCSHVATKPRLASAKSCSSVKGGMVLSASFALTVAALAALSSGVAAGGGGAAGGAAGAEEAAGGGGGAWAAG